MKILLVPLHLDALVLKADGSFIEPMADFRRLPYFDGTRDVNPGVPYLSEAILSEPFENKNLHLPAGVHLHWAMPDALTRGVSDREKLRFPRLPNRWIVRRTKNGNDDRAWLIESDALSRTLPPEQQSSPECAITYPYADSSQPYRYIGRRFLLTDWLTQFNKHKDQQKFDINGEYLDKDHPLTVIGYGEPTFAAFYPNCASIFGMYDSSSIDPHKDGIAYDLIGWYSDAPQNAVTELLAKPPGQGIAPIAQWYKDAREKLGWEISGKGQPDDFSDLPTDLFFFAHLDFGEDATHDSGNTKVVFGNTPSQALAAFLASQVDATSQTQMQEQLESILLAPALAQSQVDSGAKFVALRHERSFNAMPGGTLWTLKADSAGNTEPGEPGASAQEYLPDALAFALDKLNQLQAALDRNQTESASLAKELYSDWAKYMMSAYPPDGNPAGYPDPDAVGSYILMGSQSLQSKLADSSLEINLASARTEIEEALADLVLLRMEDVLDWQKIQTALKEAAANPDDTFTGPDGVWRRFLVGCFNECPTSIQDRLNAKQSLSPEELEILLGKINEMIIWRAQILYIEWWEVQLGEALKKGEIKPQEIGIRADTKEPRGEPQQPTLKAQMRQSAKEWLEAQLPGAIWHRVLYKLQDVPAPRYWIPNDPVALLAGDAANHNDRYDVNEHVPCLVFTPKAVSAPLACPEVWDMISQSAQQQKYKPLQSGVRTRDKGPWHPFLLEWIVVMHPLQGKLLVQSGHLNYDPQLISKNYTLPENAVDLQLLPGVKFESTEKAFRGRSILTRHAETRLTEQLAAYLAQNLPAELCTAFPSTPKALEKYLKGCIDQPTPNDQSKCKKHVVDDLLDKYEQGIKNNSKSGYDASSTVYTALRAYAKLVDTPSLSQSLDGFNQALLMQTQTLQLLPADPIGFEAVRPISDVVAQAISGGQDTAPQPLNDFNPIRAGFLGIQRLRLVDTFGQVLELDVSNVLSGASMPTLTDSASEILMPPRLAQPARLNFRWLSGRLNQSDGSTALEMSSHPATSPICGWLVPNRIDTSLGVYDAGGHSMGVLKKSGGQVQWDIAPGEFYRRVDQISNPHLGRVVSELLERSQANSNFLDQFLLCIDDAIENIEPEGSTHHDALALFLSHPLAVVRASLDLQLQGRPANNQSWNVFSNEIAADPATNSGARETQGFTKVAFDIRLGEYRRLGDGLVGFWLEVPGKNAGEPRTLQQGFFLNDSTMADIVNQNALNKNDPTDQKILTILLEAGDRVHKDEFLFAFPDGQTIWDKKIKDGVIKPIDTGSDIIYYAENPDLQQSIESPPLVMTMLVDPRGAVHVTSGIQPVKSIQIPPAMYADAVRAIELTYFTTLILTRPGSIELPLPEEAGFRWSWLELVDEGWNEYLPGTPPSLNAEFGSLELREGWLKFNRTEDEEG
jgi:hypothetical protein